MSEDPSAARMGSAEARVLGASLALTVVVAIGGIICGLISGSMAIIFDGLFSGIDAAMTAVALQVARLVRRETDMRHQFGYWHFEPLVLALNSSVLTLLCIYAFVNAVAGLINGGHATELGLALVYSGLVSVGCIAMYVYQRTANRALKSDLVSLDMQGWLMSGVISLALLGSFGLAILLRGTRFEGFAAIADPLVLALLAPLLLIGPVRAARKAFREVFMITPPALDRHVRAVLDDVASREGFLDYTSYSTKVGRAEFVELYILLPADSQGGIGELDALREHIETALGKSRNERWLTVSFTADPRWMKPRSWSPHTGRT
ncbi:cation diffusion facilitator family transporter [Brevundimonas sp.]|uniref:cation diffusion facilitator family transporter n=1 Tax=Brevundimonas sp. TaxID=1871086 RepID=UPI002FCAA0CC